MKSEKALLAFGVLLVVAACTTSANRGGGHEQMTGAIQSSAKVEGEGNVKSPSGKVYRYFKTDDKGKQAATYEQRIRERQFALAEAADTVRIEITKEDVFLGSARKEAKTTIVHRKIEVFPTLKQLLASLPSDNEMLNYDPKIGRDTARVAEEVRNVGVCGYIVAVKREADNDYHIILSDGAKSFMNTEITGLPQVSPQRDLARLIKVRRDFEGFVAEEGRRAGTYTGWGDAVPVYMEGSLFYDIEHRPGAVGPNWATPKSSWEIHPITKLEFESAKCPS